MKKILAIAIASIMIGSSAMGLADVNGADKMSVVNCSSWVSLRSEPSTSSARLSEVPLGATVSNCDTAANGFIKCEYNGETGYILASYLDQWLEPNPGYEESARLEDMQVTNCNEWVSLRSGPGSSTQQIAKVPLGTVLTDCYEAENGYIWVNYNGQGGYISAQYLKPYEDNLEPNTGYVTGDKLGDMQVTNCNEWVSLRSGPGSSYAQLARVPLDALVADCYEVENGYILGDYNGQTGYISAQYLKPYQDNVEPNPGYEESARLDDMQVTNCKEWVSLRSGPSSSTRQLAKVPLGTVLTDCYQAENGYIWVKYNGQGGYISDDYLKVYAQPTSTDTPASGDTTASSIVMGQKLGDMQVTNCNEWVSLRSGPGTNYSQLTRVPRDAIVIGCMQAENGYIWCCYNEQVGYVAEQYLKVYTEWMEPNMGYDPSDAIGDMQVVNCNDWVSMRSGPSTSSKRIARVPAGTVVYGCYPDENGFIWCNFGGLCGYISSDYLAARG